MPVRYIGIPCSFISGIATSIAREWVDRRPLYEAVVASKLSHTTCINPLNKFFMPLIFESFTAATSAENLNRKSSP